MTEAFTRMHLKKIRDEVQRNDGETMQSLPRAPEGSGNHLRYYPGVEHRQTQQQARQQIGLISHVPQRRERWATICKKDDLNPYDRRQLRN